LRAIVWRLTGNFQRATQIAAGTGQLVAFGFMAIGVMNLVSGGIFNGLWLIFIGWFLQNAAASSLAQANIEHRLSGVTVAQAMSTDCQLVPGALRLDELVNEQVLGSGKRCFLVADGERLQGLLTLRDITAVAKERWAQMTAGQTMVPLTRLVTVAPATPLLTALQTMDGANVAQVPVVEGNAIVGLLTREQVLHYVRLRTELGM
jgi:CBS domain-containing protein